MPLILEGLVTTLGADGAMRVSPMGPIVDEAMQQLLLRPFPPSATLDNLQRSKEGIFHVTDDVLMLAQAIANQLPPLATTDATCVEGKILTDACRWYAFRVERIEPRQPRMHVHCRVVDCGRLRDFFGLHRAKHAVVEAAILATRTHLLPAEEIRAEINRLSVIVEKTAGDHEQAAFALVQEYVASRLSVEDQV